MLFYAKVGNYKVMFMAIKKYCSTTEIPVDLILQEINKFAEVGKNLASGSRKGSVRFTNENDM